MDFWGRKLQLFGYPKHQERARQGICYTRRQSVYVGLLLARERGNQRLWQGHGAVTTDSLLRVAKALEVRIVELFADYCNEHNNEEKGKKVVESGNKKPVLVEQFIPQQARVLENNPAFALPPSIKQARVPYRKAA